MKRAHRPSKLFVSGLCVLWLGLAGRQAAQGAMSVTPANPTISAGQTQQFTANGATASAPTGVSAGGEYTCVRLPDGTAHCTGRNQFGQLGDGSWADSSVLVPVSGLTTATDVTAGDEFACALLANGTARCWGLGESGQRGDGTFGTFALTPVAVNSLTGAVGLAAGYGHACALLSNAHDAVLGREPRRAARERDHRQSRNPPAGGRERHHRRHRLHDRGLSHLRGARERHAAVLGTERQRAARQRDLHEFVHAGAGQRHHRCRRRQRRGRPHVRGADDGTVRCWGENDFGQLGNGTTAGATTPVQVTGLAGAVDVSAGWRHTCALLGNGTVQCWGQNQFGQLGNGTTTSRTTPVPVSGITGAIGVTAGWWHHSCALLGGGTVRCWGVNEWGQFGNGTRTSATTPVDDDAGPESRGRAATRPSPPSTPPGGQRA